MPGGGRLPDRDRELRAAATAKRLLVDTDDAARRQRQARAMKSQEPLLAARRARLAELHRQFIGLHQSRAVQQRGYQLKRLLADLFAAHDVEYRSTYRTERKQLDGSFQYKSFTYLVEARWRAVAPDFGDLADFNGKVDGKIESTRGLFVSVAGFDLSVVDYFFNRASGTRNNVLLLDGADLTLILEGRMSLTDADSAGSGCG